MTIATFALSKSGLYSYTPPRSRLGRMIKERTGLGLLIGIEPTTSR